MIEPLFVEYPDAEAMADSLAGHMALTLAEATEARDIAGLIVSGGSTPKALFQRLAKRKLDWEKICITLADDRWVDADHPASNEKLVHESLLVDDAKKASFISLKTPAKTAVEGAPDVQKRLMDFPWAADLVLLGMGEDGHTASLFPGAEALNAVLSPEGTDLCLGLTPKILPKDAPFERMTLTLPALLDSARIILMLKGAGKRHVYDRAMAGTDIYEMPIRAILQQHEVPVEVHWAP
ncbi:6-phosphogluconolactonase [Iodidimonas muriae]|uniref:6-phosphogluconolactonase n=1 Tax=Iodidimonas muriae TaxID=261467 RepID=A0ABQ2LAX1_9PROT|nr:6-phosphogluconolactonase [Iodidimonas muriae]GER05775.1 6-phosphogluconolactonase [Kordiimonadales bacterium JCM 17843]GGO06842.1 6-phosphogluconolactonase [Iodidimonas muriae]